ncbi:hypothetical protein RI367_006844 [Sorochytrium milnesiophthora]
MNISSAGDTIQSLISSAVEGSTNLAAKLVPDTQMSKVLLATGIVAAATVVRSTMAKVNKRDDKGHPIPPGPTPWPIFGSFWSLTKYPELVFTDWARKYGDLYSFWLGNQLFLIVSDPGIVKDLLVTRGKTYSSRKLMFIKNQTIFTGRGITDSQYNDTWRKHRRIAMRHLHPTAVDNYAHVMEFEALELVRTLYRDGQAGQAPINPQPHAGRCSLNNMLTIAFATRTDSLEHPMVATALKISREFMNCTGPVANMVDHVELLQYLPTKMHQRGKDLHDTLIRVYGDMIHDMEKRMAAGEQIPHCLVKDLILTREEENLDWQDMCMLASAFMIGGVETTAAIMQWFAALIPSYPDIQAKAHEELDRVIGRGRMPTLADETSLPYIRALIKEIERVHNPFWLGAPHYTTADDVYQGHFIPKDTVVIINSYAMHMNPQRHPDPEKFLPERYLGDNTSQSESANQADPYARDHWIFGAGRRVCAGIAVAEREIYLAVARMLWCFTMHKIPGEEIDLKEYDGLSGRSPVPFRIKMVPRHDQVAEVLGMSD